jgi:hypothetical protein
MTAHNARALLETPLANTVTPKERAEVIAIETYFSDWPEDGGGQVLSYSQIIELLEADSLKWVPWYPFESMDQNDLAGNIESLHDDIVEAFGQVANAE